MGSGEEEQLCALKRQVITSKPLSQQIVALEGLIQRDQARQESAKSAARAARQAYDEALRHYQECKAATAKHQDELRDLQAADTRVPGLTAATLRD